MIFPAESSPLVESRDCPRYFPRGVQLEPNRQPARAPFPEPRLHTRWPTGTGATLRGGGQAAAPERRAGAPAPLGRVAAAGGLARLTDATLDAVCRLLLQ